jgi:hypothetical protein
MQHQLSVQEAPDAGLERGLASQMQGHDFLKLWGETGKGCGSEDVDKCLLQLEFKHTDF